MSVPTKRRKKTLVLPNVTPTQWRAVVEFAVAFDKLPTEVRLALLNNGHADAVELKKFRSNA